MSFGTIHSEADLIARVERLELDIRNIRRRLEHTANMADKRVLDKQIGELKLEVTLIKERLTPRPPKLVAGK
jgi:predicted  nucleic acid-binding Zn-ribbon protein